MANKTGSIISLIGGIAIIFMGVMAVLSGEASAKGMFLLVPMLFGLYLIISGIMGMIKKQPTPSTTPLQSTNPVTPASPAQTIQQTTVQQPVK